MNVLPISLDVAFVRKPTRRASGMRTSASSWTWSRKIDAVHAARRIGPAWQWLEPILKDCKEHPGAATLRGGNVGPTTSSTLIARDGNAWREES